jgi:1-pyrroline-5-carboxylate dehydrogenase
MNGRLNVPVPTNEPARSYAPGTPERDSIKARLASMESEQVDIPLIIDGKEIRTGSTSNAVMPHRHSHVLATSHRGGADEIKSAIKAATDAHHEWSSTRWEDRASIFLTAAELLATTWRDTLNSATMLDQSKTIYQAEVDAACELADFLRFNVHFAQQIYERQPISSEGVWNRTDYRPLEGFIYAVSPFNFTAIGGNLSATPAIMGNTILWKPSSAALLGSYYVMRLFEAAGLPPGVINFVPAPPAETTELVLSSPDFAGAHFTGSTGVFQGLWKTAGERIANYRSYPRLVGETGGKDYIVAHPSANVAALKTAIVRGSFEYQGQKCSASSRAYIPESIWKQLKDPLIEETNSLTMGEPTDFRNFMGAVIHARAFEKITGYIDRAAASADADVIAGGDYDDSEGYFIRPTIILSHKPDYESMCDEIFGPVITIYVYPDADWAQMLSMVESTSPYALTGAVFSQDRAALREARDILRFTAGNFYMNDKPSGAVVGQQPFGGARASGTNDKAGSVLNLLRWTSAQSIKETFVPATDYRYPSMDAE